MKKAAHSKHTAKHEKKEHAGKKVKFLTKAEDMKQDKKMIKDEIKKAAKKSAPKRKKK